ncbi:MAG: flagellar biosynthesis protein FlgN, partial [Spirochaetaceae bacterium]|jgi:hypothetical protein|nr:flagellar biosynthesis protein FlgN [Spirochaetaceae bacterium]
MEETILKDIYAIQKVIDPLEAMYRSVCPGNAAAHNADGGAPVSEVTGLKAALEGLKSEAAARIECNKALLASRMSEIRQEIKILKKNPYISARPVYSDDGVASLVDIRG